MSEVLDIEKNEKRGRGRPPGIAKTGGRQKGSVDLTKLTTKNNLRLFVNMNFTAMTQAWEQIKDPYSKVMAFAKIMNFVYPQMRAVEFKGEDANTSIEAKMLIMMKQTIKDEIEDAESEDVE